MRGQPDPRTDVEMCQAQRQPLNSKVPKPDKPKVEKVRRWTRLKSGLFGWKTVNVVQGLPKPSCNKIFNNQTLTTSSKSDSANYSKENIQTFLTPTNRPEGDANCSAIFNFGKDFENTSESLEKIGPSVQKTTWF